jgi:hypothetical protein
MKQKKIIKVVINKVNVDKTFEAGYAIRINFVFTFKAKIRLDVIAAIKTYL